MFLELFDGGTLQTVVMIVGETTVMNSSGAVAGRKMEPRSNKYELKIINKKQPPNVGWNAGNRHVDFRGRKPS